MANAIIRLPRRILGRCLREARMIARHAYLKAYAIPRLRLSGYIKGPAQVSSGYESILLMTEASCLKLAISTKSTIFNEYYNYTKLISAYPPLIEILPEYRYIQRLGLAALLSARLSSVHFTDAEPHAVEMLRKLRGCNTAPRRLTISDCPEIQAGLQCMETAIGAETTARIHSLVTDFLAHGQYSVGLAHGDFHSRNIMQDASGKMRIIDLDCVRLQGVQEFDALYFVLEQEWSSSGQIWTKTLAECLAGSNDKVKGSLKLFNVTWSKELALAYCLDRVGQDILNYGFGYPKSLLEPILNAAMLLTHEHGN